MRVGVRCVDPPVADRQTYHADRQTYRAGGGGADSGGLDPDAGPLWIIEELDPSPRPQPPVTSFDRRVVAAIALGLCLVATGLAGAWFDRSAPSAPSHAPRQLAALASPGPATGPTRSTEPASGASPGAGSVPQADPGLLAVAGPVEGAIVDGAVVPVRVRTGAPLGTVHLAVVLPSGGPGPDTELGAADLQADEPGVDETRIAVFAPAVALPVQLVVSTAGETAAPVTVRRSVVLRPTGSVELWRSAVTAGRGGWALTLAGVAPLVAREVRVRVTASDGTVLAAGRMANGTPAASSTGASGPAGAEGGHALGVGAFGGTLPLAGARDGDLLTVRVAWQEAAGGRSGSATFEALVPSPALRPCPYLTVEGGVIVPPSTPDAGASPFAPLGELDTWCRFARPD